MSDSTRSYAPVTRKDLKRLQQIALTNRIEFFAHNSRYAALSERVICVALCQGAALHYVDGCNGVKDFDVWTFYAELPDTKFPPRWRVERDFGDPKFGKSPDKPEFAGRRVDLLGRSLQAESDADPMVVLRHYLSEGRTSSAQHLAQKAVVILEPTPQLGSVIWPIGASR